MKRLGALVVVFAVLVPRAAGAWTEARLREYEVTLRLRPGRPARVTLDMTVEIIAGRLTGFDLGTLDADARLDPSAVRATDDKKQKFSIEVGRLRSGVQRLSVKSQRGLAPGVAHFTVVYETNLDAVGALAVGREGPELRWAAPTWQYGMFRAALHLVLPYRADEVRLAAELPCERVALGDQTLVECEKIRPPPLYAMEIAVGLPAAALVQPGAAGAPSGGASGGVVTGGAGGRGRQPGWRGPAQALALFGAAALLALVAIGRVLSARRIARAYGRVVRFVVPRPASVRVRAATVLGLGVASLAIGLLADARAGALVSCVGAALCLARYERRRRVGRSPEESLDPGSPPDASDLVAVDRGRLRVLIAARRAAWRASRSVFDASTPLGALLLLFSVSLPWVAVWALGAAKLVDPRAAILGALQLGFGLVTAFASLPRRSIGPLRGADEIVALRRLLAAAKRTLGHRRSAGRVKVCLMGPATEAVASDLRVCLIATPGANGADIQMAQIEVSFDHEGLLVCWLPGATAPVAPPPWATLTEWILSVASTLVRSGTKPSPGPPPCGSPRIAAQTRPSLPAAP